MLVCSGDSVSTLNPIERARDQESVERYTVEPSVIAADVYRLPGRVGRGGWSWYTGSAAWMYRAWVEDVRGKWWSRHVSSCARRRWMAVRGGRDCSGAPSQLLHQSFAGHYQ